MGPVAVVVPRVLAQDLPQVPLAEGHQMIQALAAQRAHERFRESVRPRRLDRGLDDPCAVPGKDLSSAAVNLLSRSRIRNLKVLARSPRSMSKLRACWAVQAPVGCAVTPRIWTVRVSISITNRT